MTPSSDDLARLSVEERRALLVQLLQQKLSEKGESRPVVRDEPPRTGKNGSRPFTVGSLANLIEGIAAGSSGSREQETVDPRMATDALLEPEVRPPGPLPEGARDPKRVLLTGATGFLGAFLLRELLEETRATVYCLVRASDRETGLRRIVDTLTGYGLWDDAWHGRLVPVPGNLARQRLGLSEVDFDYLAERLDAVYHAAALVNFLANYEALRSPNVQGTRELLRWACHKRTKAVHFISTLAILPVAAFDANGSAPELDHLGSAPPISSGYAQSKWVADKLVLAARDRGLPVTVHRPGLVTGHSVTGVANPDDALTRALKACLLFRLAPAADVPIDMTPVDFVSRAVVYLSRRPESLGKAFHLANPQPMAWPRVLEFLRQRGHAIEEVPYNIWQGFLAGAGSGTENPMAMLSPLFIRLPDKDRAVVPMLRFDCRRTEAALAPAGIRCPAIDADMLGRYAAHLTEPTEELVVPWTPAQGWFREERAWLPTTGPLSYLESLSGSVSSWVVVLPRPPLLPSRVLPCPTT